MAGQLHTSESRQRRLERCYRPVSELAVEDVFGPTGFSTAARDELLVQAVAALGPASRGHSLLSRRRPFAHDLEDCPPAWSELIAHVDGQGESGPEEEDYQRAATVLWFAEDWDIADGEDFVTEAR